MRRQESLREQQSIMHQRQPRRVLQVILVENRRRRRVVRRIRIDAGHLALEPRRQQAQRLEILSVHQQAVRLLLQRSGVRERRQQAVGEVAVEMPSVHHEVGILAQKIHGRRLAPPRVAVRQIANDLVGGEQPHPLATLRRVGRDLRVECFRYAVQGDAPVRLPARTSS